MSNLCKRIALKLVQKRKKDTVVGKSTGLDVSKYIVSSFQGTPESYYADVVVSDMHADSDNESMPSSIMIQDITGMKADLEHINLKKKGDIPFVKKEVEELLDTQPLFEVISVKKDGTRKVGKLKFNPTHKQFPVVWKNIADFGVSPEYKISKDYNTYEMIGLSGTFTPRNERAKVLFAYRG